MSFASMHDDYLDPDRAGLNDENWDLDLGRVETELKKLENGCWDWDKLTISWTGKDADLEPWGHQGLALTSCDAEHVVLTVHGTKTIAGDDACLNYPSDFDHEDDEKWNKVQEKYVEQAELVVQGCSSDGYWSGDDWSLGYKNQIEVPWVFESDGVTPDYAATAQAVLDAAKKDIEAWEKEVALADRICDELAGWYDGIGDDRVRLEEGKPGEGSIFNPAYWSV